MPRSGWEIEHRPKKKWVLANVPDENKFFDRIGDSKDRSAFLPLSNLRVDVTSRVATFNPKVTILVASLGFAELIPRFCETFLAAIQDTDRAHRVDISAQIFRGSRLTNTARIYSRNRVSRAASLRATETIR